jgi:hypothetical protein
MAAQRGLGGFVTELQGLHTTACGGADRLLQAGRIIPVGGDAVEAGGKLKIRLHQRTRTL